MSRETAGRYAVPKRWVSYDTAAILENLVEARSAAGVLNRLPYLQQWIDQVREQRLRLTGSGAKQTGNEMEMKWRFVSLCLCNY